MIELNTCVTIGKMTGKSNPTNAIGTESRPIELDFMALIEAITFGSVTHRKEKGLRFDLREYVTSYFKIKTWMDFKNLQFTKLDTF